MADRIWPVGYSLTTHFRSCVLFVSCCILGLFCLIGASLAVWHSRCYSPNFRNESAEVQKAKATWTGSQSKFFVGSELEFWSLNIYPTSWKITMSYFLHIYSWTSIWSHCYYDFKNWNILPTLIWACVQIFINRNLFLWVRTQCI